MDKFTVKARKRQGTRSLDLTIPTEIVKEQDISPGDIFKVRLDKEKDTIILEYTRIYKNK